MGWRKMNVNTQLLHKYKFSSKNTVYYNTVYSEWKYVDYSRHSQCSSMDYIHKFRSHLEHILCITYTNTVHKTRSVFSFYFFGHSNVFIKIPSHAITRPRCTRTYIKCMQHIFHKCHNSAALCFISIHHDSHHCVLYSDSYSMMWFLLIPYPNRCSCHRSKALSTKPVWVLKWKTNKSLSRT